MHLTDLFSFLLQKHKLQVRKIDRWNSFLSLNNIITIINQFTCQPSVEKALFFGFRRKI